MDNDSGAHRNETPDLSRLNQRRDRSGNMCAAAIASGAALKENDLIRHGFAVPPFRGPAGPFSLKQSTGLFSRRSNPLKGKAL